MRMKAQLLKMILGTGLAGWLFFDALDSVSRHGGRYFNVVLGVMILLLTVGTVRFMRGTETVWVFLLSVLAFMAVNIRAAVLAVNVILAEYSGITKVLFGIVFYLSFLAAEEIVLGTAGRILWPRQKDVFLDAKRSANAELCE